MGFLGELITSRVRARLLTLLLTHPDDSYYLKGLVRQLDENNNAIRIELHRLERLGLLTSAPRHGRKEYQMNKASPIYAELRSLVLKTDGVASVLGEALAAAGRVQQALIYGSFAQGAERASSDIDLLVVGDVDPAHLRHSLREAQRILGREINESVYGPDEFSELKEQEGSFVWRVLSGPTIAVLEGHAAS